jgi:High-affinity nickel-transport protein
MTLLPALTLGFALGLRHATDADHIAAVGTLSADGKSSWRAASMGASWGIGHSLSVLLVGGALVIMRLPMPVRLALALEFMVALMLVGLGVRSLVARRQQGQVSATRPLLIGVMHGLAGSAVLALLVISTTTSALGAAVYLVCFCVGTIAGMAAVTVLMTLPVRASARHAVRIERFVRVAAGVASIAIGLSLAHRVGIEDGLFAAVPHAAP